VRGALAKAHRKTANEGALKAVQSLTPVIKGAYENEQTTRGRVEALEGRAKLLEEHRDRAVGFMTRGFWGRLRWLFSGR
jgi:hypothetical protein